MGESIESPPVCRDCDDPGVVYFAGTLYCGRCALEHLVRALLAEVDTTEVGIRSVSDDILVEH